MSFLRPEAVATLLRWRELAVGLAATGLGLYWALGDAGLMRWIGGAFIVGGLAIAREGFSRAQRPADGGGAGVVVVDERQVTYLSGLGGGAVSIDGLHLVEVETTAAGPGASDLFWHLYQGDTHLVIPGDAEGAAQIFDALAALPGVNYQAALTAASSTDAARYVIWRSADTPLPRRLH